MYDNNNNYDSFMSQAPKDTRILVKKAIQIYLVIKMRCLTCIDYNFSYPQKRALNPNDKMCISLFLAGLLSNDNIRDIFYKSDITSDKVADLFHIELTYINEISDRKYRECFNLDFKSLINDLETGTIGNDKLCAERIMLNLASRSACRSNIVDCFYQNIGYSTPQEHVSYKVLSDSINAKEDSMYKKLTYDEPIDLSYKAFNPEAAYTERSYSSKDLDLKNSPLKKYGEFLNERKYVANPAIGRNIEIKNLMLSLLTPDKSAILVGEAGVGKTAIVEGLAYLINEQEVPKLLENKKIVKISTSSLLQGCKYRGMFEEKIESIIEELKTHPEIILFIDEMHTVIGAGSNDESNLDFANILKPYLDRGQIKMIGATTTLEYEKYIMSDSAFKRRFEKVNILEPKEDVVKAILDGSIPKIEQATQVEFDFDEDERFLILNYITNVSSKKNRIYNDVVNNPDLALTILKKAFAYAAFYEDDVVQIEHITEAIRTCERITESARNRYADELLSKLKEKEGLTKPSCKIIQFPVGV